MRARAREVFIAALSQAHRWLDELLSDAEASIATVAARECKSERSVRMTLSLVFLAPDLVRAAIDGRLPRGFNRTRLVDLPMLWSEQWRVLGLEPPVTRIAISAKPNRISPAREGSKLRPEPDQWSAPGLKAPVQD
jgi:hypothetical protein